jgi:L-ascorbate peroxidase
MKASVVFVAAFAVRSGHVCAFTVPRPAGVRSSRLSALSMAVSIDELKGAQDMIDNIIDKKNCGPVLVRLAWHDSGTFDVNVKGEWPAAGGAIASIRFSPEIDHGANAGLAGACKVG